MDGFLFPLTTLSAKYKTLSPNTHQVSLAKSFVIVIIIIIISTERPVSDAEWFFWLLSWLEIGFISVANDN